MADTQLQQLVINELTKAQYEALTPEQRQLYLVTDEVPLDSSDIATTISSSSTNSQAAGALAVYNAIQASGGAGLYVIGITISGSTITADKTYTEIKSAYDTGKILVLVDTSAISGWRYSLSKALSTDSGFRFEFVKVSDGYYEAQIDTIKLVHTAYSDTWSIDYLLGEVKTNKVNTFPASPTNAQYPSAKCVSDALATKASLNGDQTQNFAVKSALNQANNTYAVNKADLDTMVGNINTLLETI